MTTQKKVIAVIASLRNVFRYAMFNYKGSRVSAELRSYLDVFKNASKDLMLSRRNEKDLLHFTFILESSARCDLLFAESKFQELAVEVSSARARLSELAGLGSDESGFEVLTEDRPDNALCSVPYDLQIILDNIRSPFNVGGFFRTGDAVRATKIHLCGISPSPDQPRVQRSAMKTDEVIPWERHLLTEECVCHLKELGYFICSVETATGSVPLDQIRFKEHPKLALVFGNEEFGVSHAVLKMSDCIISLPMLGRKNSLNVTVTGGIVLFDVLRAFI